MEQFIALIEKCITKKDEQMTITADMEMVKDIGMTSLDMMVLLCATEQTYDVILPICQLAGIKTIGDLYALICSLPRSNAQTE